jgi:hypothetical protein
MQLISIEIFGPKLTIMFKNAMALHGSEVYLTVVSTRSGHTLERFLVIKIK